VTSDVGAVLQKLAINISRIRQGVRTGSKSAVYDCLVHSVLSFL